MYTGSLRKDKTMNLCFLSLHILVAKNFDKTGKVNIQVGSPLKKHADKNFDLLRVGFEVYYATVNNI